MKILKQTIAVILALLLLSGSFVCFAADGEKEFHKYEKYVLLGDSIASGYTDYAYRNTEFTFAPESYSDFLAQELGAELIPLACPGFRTLEMRRLFEDDYYPDDKYLFNAIPNTPGYVIETMKPDIRNAVSEADLITLGIGGNDWGAYVGWVMTEIFEAKALPAEYIEALREFLVNASFEDDIIGQIVDIANKMNALPELIEVLPQALAYGYGTLLENWDIMIQDIYDLNPDVTLVVVGMYAATLTTEKDAPDVVIEADPLKAYAEQLIIDFGNKPMIDSQAKFGYIYVDTTGTIVEVSHPTVAGHRHIADRILEALPDARFPYADVALQYPTYKAIEYMYFNGLMTGIDETTFGADVKITKAELSAVLNKISDSYAVSDSSSEVTNLELDVALFKASGKTGIIDLFKQLVAMVKLVLSGDAFKTVTRAEAAVVIYEIVK